MLKTIDKDNVNQNLQFEKLLLKLLFSLYKSFV